jgi:hypothetical protein
MTTQWFLDYYIPNENLTTSFNKDKWQIIFLQHNAFYVDNFTIKYLNTTLVEDVDYIFILPYRAATRIIGKPIYAGLLVDKKYEHTNLKAAYKPVNPDLEIDRNILINRISGDIDNINLRALDELIEGIQDFPYQHGYPDYVNYDSNVVYINKLNELYTNITATSATNDNKIIDKLSTLISQQATIANIDNYVKKAGDTMLGPLLLNYTPQNPNDAVNKSWIDNLTNTYQANISTQNLVNRTNDTLNTPLTLSRQPVANTEIATKKYIDDAISSITAYDQYPTGTLLRVNENTNIPGYLTCNGAKVSKTTYANLYSVIGDKFDPTQALGDGQPWVFQSDFNSYYIPGNVYNFFANNYNISVKNTLFPNAANNIISSSIVYYLHSYHLMAVTKNKIYLYFEYRNTVNNNKLVSSPYVVTIDNNGAILSSNFISPTFNNNKIVYFDLFYWNNNAYITNIKTCATPISGQTNYFDASTIDSTAANNVYKNTILTNGDISFNNLTPVTINTTTKFNIYNSTQLLNKYIFHSNSDSNGVYTTTFKYINDTTFNLVEGNGLATSPFNSVNNEYSYFFRMKDKVYAIGKTTKKIYMSTILSNGYISTPTYTNKSFSSFLSNGDINYFNLITFENKAYCFISDSSNYTKVLIFELSFDIQGVITGIALRETLNLTPIINSYRADYPNNNTILDSAFISNVLIIKNKLYLFFYSSIKNVNNISIAEYIPFVLTYDIEGGLVDYVDFSDLGTNIYHIQQNLDEKDKFYLPNYPVVNGVKTIIKF